MMPPIQDLEDWGRARRHPGGAYHRGFTSKNLSPAGAAAWIADGLLVLPDENELAFRALANATQVINEGRCRPV